MLSLSVKMVKRTTSFSKMFLVDNIRLSTYNDCCECNQDTNLQSFNIPNSNKYSANNVKKRTTATSVTENMNLPTDTYNENFPSVTESLNSTENTYSPPVTIQNNSLNQTLTQTQRDTEPTSQSHVETVNNQNRNLVTPSTKDIVPSRTGAIVPSRTGAIVPSRTVAIVPTRSRRFRDRVNPYTNIGSIALNSPPNVQELKGLTEQQQALLPTSQYANTVSNQSGGQNQRRNKVQIENHRRNRQQFALPYPPTSKDRTIARKSSNRSENFSQIQQPALEMERNYQQPGLEMERNYQQPALEMETNYQQPALEMETNYQQPALDMETNYQQPALEMETNYQQPALEMHPNAITSPNHPSSTKRKHPPTANEKSLVSKTSNRITQYQNHRNSTPENVERLSLDYSPRNLISSTASKRSAGQIADYQNYLSSKGSRSKGDVVTYLCQICDTSFQTYNKLLKHRKRHNELDQKERGSKRKDDEQNSLKLKQIRN